MLNLLSNAVKFTKRGSVTLRVSREPYGGAMRLRFEVADTRLLAGTQTGLLGSRMNLPYRAVSKHLGTMGE